MNGFVKVLYAILAGFNVIFNLFVPMAIAILWVLQFGTETLGSKLLLIVGLVATLYRALDFMFIKEEIY